MKKGFTTFLSALKANTPPCKKGLSSLRFLSLFLILFLAVGNAWAQETVLFEADFSDDIWADATFKQANTTNPDVINGITFYSKSSSNKFSISGGVLTWPNSNMSSNNYYLGFPVTGINDGTITITVWNGSSATRVKYVIKNNADAFSASIGSSGTATSSANPTTVTITSLSTKAFVYLGRQGSGLTTITKIVVTTPAPPCDATAPGNISKGALDAGELTLTAEGSPADKNVWYWQSSATGEDKTHSGASRTVTAAGTYYIRSLYDDDCWSDAKSFEVKTTDLVANYTVIYKDGSEELKRVTVAVGNTPDAYTPTKDCYTFAGWDPALNTVSGNEGDEIEVNATWTAKYFTESVDFETGGASAVSGVASKNIVASNAGSYDGGKESENWAYKGWKIKSNGATVKVLVQAGKKLTFKFGYLAATAHVAISGDATYSVTGASKVQNDPLKYTTYSWTKDYDALYTFTTGSGDAAVIKALTIQDTYTATRVDAKSDGAGSDPYVAETTLPTPTAVSGWTFTGWIANQDVKDSEDNTKTAGTTLSAGTYTLLANVTFTAQWTEASGTYDITYSSAHGTAPVAANAASVVLTELSEEGWAHKGWTANVDVTVDAATVTAGTLIANGKTAILASDVTFTAVWKEVFTVTFESKGGSSVDPVDVEDGASLDAAPDDPTKTDYVFQGWSETDGGPVVADITTLTIGADKILYAKWALDVQVTELVFSNSFKGWINGSNITVFYMAGESAPTIVSYEGKNLKAADAVAIVGDEVVATGSDDSEKHYTLTMTEVTPLTTTGAKQTFDGTEGYVKSAAGWASDKGWKFQRLFADGRVAKGLTREYFFFGPAESATFTWKVVKKNDGDPAVAYVYVDGVLATTITSKSISDPVVVNLKNTNSIVAFESAQTNGDCGLMDVTLAPWVSTTGVALQEGDDPISSKTIWESTNFTLTAIVTPDNASNKTITWTSSDDEIATVVNGVVTGVAASATPVTITATTVDGKSATCEVTVTTAPTPSVEPTITTQPAGANYYEGATIAALEVVATGSGDLSYQWYLGSDEIDGATAAKYTPTVSAIGSYVYHCVVTNTETGHLPTSLASNNATITIAEDPAAIKLLDGEGKINTTNFTTGVTKGTVTISEVSHNCAVFGSTGGSIVGLTGLNKVVAYNATTTQTKVKFVLYNENNSSKEMYLQKVLEGATEAVTETIAVPSKTYHETQYYEYNSSDLRSFYVTVNSTSIKILQVKVIETGTILKRAGQVGYDLNLNKGRVFGKGGSNISFEGLNATFSSDYKPISSTEARINSTNISFNIASPVLLKVTTSNNKKYYVSQELNGTDNATEKTGTSEFELKTIGTWYVKADASEVKITKIEFLAPKCEQPQFNALANSDICSDDPYVALNGTATVSDGGTVTYKWYAEGADESDPAAVLDTDAEYTPGADGAYYVVATNSLAGYTDNVVQSEVVTVTTHTGTAISEGLVNQRGVVDDVVTLTVTASGKDLHYTWKECATIGGTYTDVAGAADAASLDVTITEGLNKYYKVIVHGDCGEDQESIAKVEQFVPVVQQNVTGSTVWDWTEAASVNEIKLTDATTPKQNEGFVMANGAATVYNNANFESDKLYLEGEYIIRTEGGKLFQGQTIKFNTTVAGAVRVTFSHTGKNKPARELFINGVGTGTSVTGTSQTETGLIEVPAGEVAITAFHVNPTDGAGQQYVRVYKIEFLALGHRREASWIVPNELGTVCLKDECIIKGAELYELQGPDANRKLVFDEITSGELEAGKPYLFNATATGRISFYNKVKAAHTETAGSLNGMYGTFENLTFSPATDQNIYYFSGHNIWAVKKNTADVQLPAYLCYVKMDELLASPTPDANPAPGRRRVTLGVNGQQVATGVDQVQGDEVPTKMIINGQLFILRGEKMYDAQGKLVK